MKVITLPGLIDIHVHLRDPGQTQKEDFYSGTAAALAGGFTTVLDMPNNAIPITNLERLKEKIQIARKQTVCDIGFYLGSLGENLDELKASQKYVFGLKIYLNQTTGGYIVDEKVFKKICTVWPNKLPILLHAEADVIEKMIEIGHKARQKIHICHVSSEAELQTIIHAKQKGYQVTCGVTAHHLFLNKETGKKLGVYGMMKPSLKPKKDVDFLWAHLKEIDVIESDHAPHTKGEKQSSKPTFGVPGLETTLALLLNEVDKGKITIGEIKRLCCFGPKKIFSMKMDKNTKIVVDTSEEWTIDNTKLYTTCGWSPFHGWKVKGRVKKVFIRGRKVFENGKVLVKPGMGKVLINNS